MPTGIYKRTKGKISNWKGGITKKEGYFRDRQRRIRLATIEALGGKCIKCGFDDKRALQIDHINGGGNKERIKRKESGKSSYGSGYYREVLQSFLKDENKYQLLCANCNWIKRFENNEILKKGRLMIII